MCPGKAVLKPAKFFRAAVRVLITKTVSVTGISMPKSLFVVPITRVANENVAPDFEHVGGLNLRLMLRKYAVTGATHSSTADHPAGLARQSTTVHPAVSACAG